MDAREGVFLLDLGSLAIRSLSGICSVPDGSELIKGFGEVLYFVATVILGIASN